MATFENVAPNCGTMRCVTGNTTKLQRLAQSIMGSGKGIITLLPSNCNLLRTFVFHFLTINKTLSGNPHLKSKR